jgi:hypothetical protein
LVHVVVGVEGGDTGPDQVERDEWCSVTYRTIWPARADIVLPDVDADREFLDVDVPAPTRKQELRPDGNSPARSADRLHLAQLTNNKFGD